MRKLFALLLALTMVFALAACGGGSKNPSSGSGTSGTENQQNSDGGDVSSQKPAGPADLSWWSGADGFKEFLPYSGPGAAMEEYEDGPHQDIFDESIWRYCIVDVTKEDFDAYVDQLVENGAILWKSKGDPEEDAQLIEIDQEFGHITFQSGNSEEDWLITIDFGKGALGNGPLQISFSVSPYWI